MKIQYSSPEIFIRQSSILQQAITPASTATTAIIGSFPKGKMRAAKLVRTWEEFENFYGGLTRNTLSSHCVKQFFDNEGQALWVIRIGTGQLKGADPFLLGLSLLDRINDFNILCIPQIEQLPDVQAAKVIQAAITLAAQHRAIYLLDIPRREASRHTITALRSWMNRQSGIRHPNVALYVPRVHVPQTRQRSPLHAIPASGTMAGVFARTDHNRGVWESPAGTEAILQGVQGLEQTLTQLEMGQLNGMGINPIRQISPSHSVAWGARTVSSDPEWKYVSVRRTALFIESSIRKGLAWTAFEPNDEPLWTQIRQSLEVFMQTLFHKGAFQGQKPQEAYFIKCGRETISAADQRAGLVHMTIGFAPLKPAGSSFSSFNNRPDLPDRPDAHPADRSQVGGSSLLTNSQFRLLVQVRENVAKNIPDRPQLGRKALFHLQGLKNLLHVQWPVHRVFLKISGNGMPKP